MRLPCLLLCLAVFVLCEEHLAQWKEPPRDCSDAPNSNIKHTCLMIREMDRQTRLRLRRQVLAGASPISPRLPNRRQAARNRLQALGIPQPGAATTPRPTLAPRPTVNPNDIRADGPPSWQIPVPVPPMARGQTAYHPYDCMTLRCLCPFFRGTMRGDTCILASGQPLGMAYRKEYRMMSENERSRWHSALNTLKRNGEYDAISRQHLEVGIGSGAHSGPGFLPWHREYLKRFEIALRMVDPTVAIPYWDSVMDNYLPDPRDSILFSNLFAGETDWFGNVIQGPFAYWPTLEGRGTILRQLGQEGQLFNEAQINGIVQQNDVTYVLAYTAPLASCPFPNNYGAVEYVHSNIHLWIGGDMKPPSTSANEPIFFMHHSFVDYLWELWRQLKQPKWYREQGYAPDIGLCANDQHFSYAWMRPFPYLQNRDGLSNSYTDQMYRYAPRPTCSVQNPTCGSPYLFCDTRGYPHCVAKIRFNGLCTGFEQFDSCYQGRCWFGRCTRNVARSRMMGSRLSNTTSLPLPSMDSVTPAPHMMAVPLFVDCYNRHPCCERWSREGLCASQPEYMSQYCQAACEVCTPNYNTTSQCPDRHISCPEFRGLGMCSGDAEDFMQENCRKSCGQCRKDKEEQCEVDGKTIKIPATTDMVTSIKYSFDKAAERKIEALKKADMRRRRRA